MPYARPVGGKDVEGKGRSNGSPRSNALGMGVSEGMMRSSWHGASKFDAEIFSMAWPSFLSTLMIPITMSVDAGEMRLWDISQSNPFVVVCCYYARSRVKCFERVQHLVAKLKGII